MLSVSGIQGKYEIERRPCDHVSCGARLLCVRSEGASCLPSYKRVAGGQGHRGRTGAPRAQGSKAAGNTGSFKPWDLFRGSIHHGVCVYADIYITLWGHLFSPHKSKPNFIKICEWYQKTEVLYVDWLVMVMVRPGSGLSLSLLGFSP